MKPEILKAIIDVSQSMEGWATSEKVTAMTELIIETDAVCVVELGVFGGRSLIPQAMALREASHLHPGVSRVIYGIDPWKKEAALEGDNDPKNQEWWGKLDLESIHQSCMQHLWAHHLDQFCVVLRCGSEHAVGLFPDYPGAEQIDILHIDGNHSELASVRDVTTWLPRVKSGGYIWFDDTNWATTQRAIALLYVSCEVVKDVGDCRLFRKR